MRATVLILAVMMFGPVGPAGAQEFPYRQPSYYRTVFMEAAAKACMRDAALRPSNIDVELCDCKAGMIATFMTAKDLEEIAQGGVHVTPRYEELAQMAHANCLKAFTGK
jgi:hypothetical protein